MTIYREPMLTSADVAARLGIAVRTAQALMASHPEASRDLRVLLPERCLPDLVDRPKRGRPRKNR